MKTETLSRRNFLNISSIAGSALTLGFYFPASAMKAAIVKKTEADMYGIELNSWVHIDTSGKVTLFSHRAEMGQGVYQAIPQIIAEELEVNLDSVNILFAQGKREVYGSQVTGGSSTVRGSYKNLLKLGATAREMLVESAGRKWDVPKTECYAQSGYHKSPGGRFHPYGNRSSHHT